MSDLKIQGEVSLDTSNADQALARVDAGARKMAEGVKQSGERAGRTIKSIGESATQTADSFTRDERRISAAIKKTTFDLESLGKTASQKFELRLGMRGADLTKFQTDLDKLRAAEIAATKSLSNMQVSAAQTAAALRGVPAQFTDIITSLQGGQAPLTVFLQQGGQLKDMFGGAGNAAKALSGYVLGLVNPLSTATVGITALGAAYYSGSQEINEFQKALILSGNAAGTTAGQLQLYAQNIDAIVGTQAAAAEALTLITRTGAVGTQNLQQFATVAIQWQKATGTAVGDTAKAFEDLKKAPLEATLKLNESMGYLTTSTYQQIKALTDQGRQIEASNLAQKLFADTLASRSPQITENLGGIERAWRAIKSTIAETVDAAKSVGREAGPQVQLQAIEKRIAEITSRGASGFGTNAGGAAFGLPNAAQSERELELLRKQADELRRTISLTQLRATEQSIAVQQAKALADWDKQGTKYLSDAVKLQRELTAARNQGIEAGRSETEIQARLNQIRADYAKKTASSGSAGVGQSEVAELRARATEAERYLESLRSLGTEAEKLTDGERRAAKIREELKTSLSGTAREQKALALIEAERIGIAERATAGEQMRLTGLEKSRQAYAQLIEDTFRGAEALGIQADELAASNAVWGKGAAAIEEYRLALLKARLVEIESGSDSAFDPRYVAGLRAQLDAQERKVGQTRIAEFKTINGQADELLRSARESATVYAEEARLIGLSAEDRAQVVALRQIELKYAKELAKVEASTGSEAEKEAARVKLAQAEMLEKSNASDQIRLQAFQKTTDQIDDIFRQGFAGMLDRGEDTWDAFTKSLATTFKTTVADAIYKTFAQKYVINATTGTLEMLGLGGGTVAGGGSSGLLGAASTAKDAYTLYSAATGYSSGVASVAGLLGAGQVAGSSAAALGYANAVGAIGGDALGALIAGNAGWSGVGVAAAAEAGAAAGAAAGTAAAGSAGTGAATTAAGMGPYGWIAAAAILAVMAFAGKGEKRYGGHYGINFEGDEVLDYRRGGYIDSKAGEVTYVVGPSGGEFATDYVTELMTGTTKGINTLLSDLGSGLALTGFQAGLETSGKGRGGVFAGGTLTGGITFGESATGAGSPFETTSTRSPDAETAVKNFASDMLQVTIQALQAATDLPKAIKAQLTGIDAEKLTDDAATQLLNSIQAQIDYVKSFRDTLNMLPFANLKDVAFDTAAGLIAAAGGIDALNQNITGYFENYFTAEEQRTAAIARTSSAFTALGLAMPDVSGEADAARAAFRAMANSIDVSTEAGQKQYAGLLSLQGAFADLTPIIDKTAEAARQAESQLQQRQQLEMQLLQLQGNTAEIRSRELAALLTDENRAIQQAIYALQDQQTADTAAKAAQDAADRVKAAWQSVGDTIADEIKRIRGVVAGDGAEGLDYLQAQFAIATGQARAGDQDAASSLPSLSKQVLDMAQQNARSALDLKVFQSQIAASLAETTKAIAASQGIVPAFAGGGTHSGGWAVVGEKGPELAYMPPARIYTADQSASMLGNTARLERLVEQLIDDNRRQAGTIASLNLRLAKAAEGTKYLLDNVTDGGNAMRTTT
ncbi:MAG: phage tail length tape measure family protein [Pseudorhodoferax sp.]